ncbi:MAG: hypothetical protein Solumvirus4_12 [Solumvirus sp.]|uniref:Phytanoyl-CoA dioxygenase n=1 Tax=Solumvirus sp. TaxID=2487773 RepID=A0A3G5AI97_9VIRU|nr:MAG: hypothetical protein Solumvirus4_12 [Solumvirus sp.]
MAASILNKRTLFLLQKRGWVVRRNILPHTKEVTIESVHDHIKSDASLKSYRKDCELRESVFDPKHSKEYRWHRDRPFIPLPSFSLAPPLKWVLIFPKDTILIPHYTSTQLISGTHDPRNLLKYCRVVSPLLNVGDVLAFDAQLLHRKPYDAHFSNRKCFKVELRK